jgi:hypothetical protein
MSQIGSPSRILGTCLVALLIPWARAGVAERDAAAMPGTGSADDPIEVILPFEMQASFFHSLPIAGHLVTPDQVAQLVQMNPRLRVTTGQPFSGTGTAQTMDQSNVVDTHADLLHVVNVRGDGRAPKP